MAEQNGQAPGGIVTQVGDDDPKVNHQDAPGWSGEGRATVESPVDSQIVADPGGTRFSIEGHSAFPKPPLRKRRWVRGTIIATMVAGIVGTGLYFAVPWVSYEWETVSTDDAFVSGHITNVGPRIDDVVTEVLVDQNDRVDVGTLLIRLDREPFAVAVAEAEASLEEARANVVQARAQVTSQLARARGAYYRRKNVQENLRRQVAALRAEVAALRARESTRKLAELDQGRIENLVKRGSASQSELDQRNNTL
jgi:membrane fusion protein (multidrug efflux system)